MRDRRLRAFLLALGVLAFAEGLLATVVPPADPRPLPFRPGPPYRALEAVGSDRVRLLATGEVVSVDKGGRRRIVVLGESAVTAVGLSPEQAFPRLLQDLLEGTEVVNLGLPGQDSGQLRQALREALEWLDPDTVVVYAGHNEFHRIRTFRYLHPAWSAEAEEVRQALERLALYRMLAAAKPQPLPTGRVGPQVHELGVHVTPGDVRLVKARFRANLEAMVEACRGRGVDVLLCTPSANDRAGPDGQRPPAGPPEDEAGRLFERGMHALRAGDFETARRCLTAARELDPAPNRSLPSFRPIVLEVAAAAGVPVCDVEEGVRARAEAGLPGTDFFRDNCHLNAAGHALVARLLAECVRSR